jgi:hypothetical protein
MRDLRMSEEVLKIFFVTSILALYFCYKFLSLDSSEWNPDVRGRDPEGAVQVFTNLNQILW